MSNFKVISKYLSLAFTIVLCSIAILLVGVRVFKINPYAIISSSMEPEYPVGSLVYVKNIDVDEVLEGDVITYILNEEGIVSTHRVVSVDKLAQQFITKGDRNTTNDPIPVHFNNYLGTVIYVIPYLGYLSFMLSRQSTVLFLIVVCGVLITVSLLKKVMKPNEKME